MKRRLSRAAEAAAAGYARNTRRILDPSRPTPHARLLDGAAGAIREWWDVHVRYRKLHRTLDEYRADLLGGFDSAKAKQEKEGEKEEEYDVEASLKRVSEAYAEFERVLRSARQSKEGSMMTTLRVGTYNLFEGGGPRLPAQLAMLRAMDLDLVALQEVKDGDRDDHALECLIANELGMQSALARSASGRCHLMLAWKPDKLTRVNYTADAAEGAFHHALQRVEFVVPATGEPLTVLNTHLAPSSDDDDRDGEARWLTEYATPGQCTLLLGDLNTIGANDPDPDWSRLPDHLHPRHRLCLDEGVFGLTDRRTIRVLVRAGFVDPFEGLPHGRNTVGYRNEKKEDDILRRSGLILGAGLKFRAAGVVDEPTVHQLSEHLPAYAVIEIQG
ncbi:endonuclease/exonuclease/phosphatase family protein [Embleya sp. AB8]|uniref:endonuclease/exonuclease/phosphatase family protein n=1 Tax=Embleya sp. AB8 TaxID=3156304 RepID=UPI003C712323